MNTTCIKQCLNASKSDITVKEVSMGRPKVARLKGFIPSLVLFILVLAYLTGYITFRAGYFQPAPKVASEYNLYESRMRLAKFDTDWLDENEARFDWKRLIKSCENMTVWTATKEWWKKRNRTDPDKSFISLWEIRPAGEYSRFFIQSQNSHGVRKTIGGDAWRVHLCGYVCLNPLIRDFGNGTYEVKFLAMESGRYKAKIYLDYTLCDGIKDPPPYWFMQGMLCKTTICLIPYPNEQGQIL